MTINHLTGLNQYSCWQFAGTHYTHTTMTWGCQHCLHWHQIYPNSQDQAKCSLCHVMSWLLSPTVSNLHDMTYKLLDCWNPWRRSVAARVMWNTVPVCVALCTSIGKWLHTLCSHQTLGENQECWKTNTTTIQTHVYQLINPWQHQTINHLSTIQLIASYKINQLTNQSVNRCPTSQGAVLINPKPMHIN